MKNKILVFAVLFIIIGCVNSKNESSSDGEKSVTSVTRFEKLSGYFVKNNVKINDDYKFVTFNNQTDFDKYFGVAKTMDNDITPLDFNKYNIAAIIVKPTNNKDDITINRYTSKNGVTTVEFSNNKGDKQSFLTTQFVAFKIPISITSVDFSTNGKTINIPVK